MDIQKEREAFLKWHYQAYLLENPEVDMSSAQYIYDYAHKNALCAQLRESHFAVWQAAKAQAVPEHANQTFEDWIEDPKNTKVYLGGYRERANEFAHQAWIASSNAKLPKDKVLMPRQLDQKHIDYVVKQLAISSGASLISEVYECLIEAQELK